MSYYWFNKLLKNAWDKYRNKVGKQKAAEYYRNNVDLIRLEASIEICQKRRRIKKGNIKEKDIT